MGPPTTSSHQGQSRLQGNTDCDPREISALNTHDASPTNHSNDTVGPHGRFTGDPGSVDKDQGYNCFLRRKIPFSGLGEKSSMPLRGWANGATQRFDRRAIVGGRRATSLTGAKTRDPLFEGGPQTRIIVARIKNHKSEFVRAQEIPRSPITRHI